jgi:hypothetical protein
VAEMFLYTRKVGEDMLEDYETSLVVGDWVKGKTHDGELIIGYVQTIDLSHGIVEVTIVTCDNEQSIGKTIKVLRKSVEKLQLSIFDNEEQLLQLIDLSLSTGDEEWFNELSIRLNSVRKPVMK